VTHILLTHGHGDHVGDTAQIAKETGAVVLPMPIWHAWLGHHHGVDKLEAGNTGGTISLGGFSATFVNALHSSAQITSDGVSHSLGNANGLMLHFEDEPSLLHMGDTDIFSDMALINELHRPEIGIVPIGDRFTMGGAVAALACRRFFSFAKVLPCHYGTFPIIDQTADAFVEAMEGCAECRRAEIGRERRGLSRRARRQNPGSTVARPAAHGYSGAKRSHHPMRTRCP
jgi:L-ascorbate metabolism protein UlaG (beta-lactamase superfamily)